MNFRGRSTNNYNGIVHGMDTIVQLSVRQSHVHCTSMCQPRVIKKFVCQGVHRYSKERPVLDM